MKKFTKKALRELKKDKDFNNRVEKRVINSLLATGLTTEELKDHIIDIIDYGCINGIVNNLIYYEDTCRFFNCYRQEILSMLKDDNKIVNYFNSQYWLNQKRYSTQEKNNLTWFIYENIVCRIALYFNLI